MDENQPPQRPPMPTARDFQAELRELERTGEISTPAGQARIRQILKILGINLDNPDGAYDTHFEVRTEPFSDEELWENTPPCFRHMLPPEVIRKFDKE